MTTVLGKLLRRDLNSWIERAIAAIEAEAVAAERARIAEAMRGIDPDDYADNGDARTAINILDRVLTIVERP